MAADAAWVGRLAEAVGGAPASPGLDARVAVVVGDAEPTVLEIHDGRITGVADGEPEVEVPLTAELVDALAAGEVSLAVAYMRGDVKPVGSSGALAVLIEVLDDPATWAALRA